MANTSEEDNHFNDDYDWVGYCTHCGEKEEIIDSSPYYVCNTCGVVTARRGHLCNPVILDEAYTCGYCGRLESTPRHICKPKARKVAYACDVCGRLAGKKSEVCSPKKIV